MGEKFAELPVIPETVIDGNVKVGVRRPLNVPMEEAVAHVFSNEKSHLN